MHFCEVWRFPALGGRSAWKAQGNAACWLGRARVSRSALNNFRKLFLSLTSKFPGNFPEISLSCEVQCTRTLGSEPTRRPLLDAKHNIGGCMVARRTGKSCAHSFDARGAPLPLLAASCLETSLSPLFSSWKFRQELSGLFLSAPTHREWASPQPPPT